jgi:hypothetical protein
MEIFRPVYIEGYVKSLILSDREISKICSGWELEREEIINILIAYFSEMGLYTVQPLEHSAIVRKEVVKQLAENKELKRRRQAISQEIEKARERNRTRGSL